jgi:hypothetical protein
MVAILDEAIELLLLLEEIFRRRFGGFSSLASNGVIPAARCAWG